MHVLKKDLCITMVHLPIHFPLCTLNWPLILKYKTSPVPGESSVLQTEY